MKSRYVCTWSVNVGDIDRNKLRFGYSGMRFQIRVSIQGSGTRISGYLLRSLVFSTGYNWLQSVPAGTGYRALYTCFNNWLQSVPAGTGYTALYTCFNLRVTKSTNRVLATQS